MPDNLKKLVIKIPIPRACDVTEDGMKEHILFQVKREMPCLLEDARRGDEYKPFLRKKTDIMLDRFFDFMKRTCSFLKRTSYEVYMPV
jgi:hypothetical protein